MLPPVVADWLMVLLTPLAQLIWWSITEPLLVMLAAVFVTMMYIGPEEE